MEVMLPTCPVKIKSCCDGNILTIVGGKLTTYHADGQKSPLVGQEKYLKKTIENSTVHLPGAPEKPWDLFLKDETQKWVSKYELKESQAVHFAQLYGKKAEEVLALLEEDPRLCEHLHPSRPEVLAQMAYAVRNEKALHLEDAMLRRLEIGYSRERWGEAAEKASRLMAELLNWDENIRIKELERYRQQLYPAPMA